MEHYLIDTNIVIDLLLEREDVDAACAVMDGAERGDYSIYLCSLSYTNIYYSLRKIRISSKSWLVPTVGTYFMYVRKPYTAADIHKVSPYSRWCSPT